MLDAFSDEHPVEISSHKGSRDGANDAVQNEEPKVCTGILCDHKRSGCRCDHAVGDDQADSECCDE